MSFTQFFIDPTGDSHVARLIPSNSDVAVVAIRGGGIQHVKERLASCPKSRIAKIDTVGLLVGGNDLDYRNRHQESTALQATLEDTVNLVEFVQQLIPKARIRTFDIIPRSSTGSIFNARARAISVQLAQVCDKHSHISFIKSFTNIDIRSHMHDKNAEKYPVVQTFFVDDAVKKLHRLDDRGRRGEVRRCRERVG